MKIKEKRTLRKIALVTFALALFAILTFVEPISSQTPFQTIRIRADGAVDPESTAIERVGDTYVFTGDVYAAIIVERANIVIDGAGYSLWGPYNGTRGDQWMIGQGPNASTNASLWTIGLDFDVVTKPNNVTVKNLNIRNFYIGMYVWTFNNTIADNSVTKSIVGVLLSGDSNMIARNYIADNDEGIFFGVNKPEDAPLNMVLTGNSFINNTVHFSGCACQAYNETEAIHTWDNGQRGNFWSDYNGTDADGDGIGDSPYIVDVRNQDRYPLMQNTLTLPTPASKLPIETTIAAVLAVAVTVVAVCVFKRRKQKKLGKHA